MLGPGVSTITSAAPAKRTSSFSGTMRRILPVSLAGRAATSAWVWLLAIQDVAQEHPRGIAPSHRAETEDECSRDEPQCRGGYCRVEPQRDGKPEYSADDPTENGEDIAPFLKLRVGGRRTNG